MSRRTNVMKHLIRKSLTAAAAVAILGVAAHANALPIGYTLTLSGSADSPYMTLGNTSAQRWNSLSLKRNSVPSSSTLPRSSHQTV